MQVRISIGILLLLMSFAAYSQEASVIHKKELLNILSQQNDTTYVINFWATWCKPCVKELPDFIETEAAYENKKVRFIYFSLNFKNQLETMLKPFLKQNNFFSEVYLVDEPDYNSWINTVDKEWQGNIPATLIYNSSKDIRNFYGHEMDKSFLNELLITAVSN